MQRKTFVWFVPALVVALGILALSTFLSVPIQIEGVTYIDKWQHLFAYSVLCLSFLYAFLKSGNLTKGNTVRILLFCSAYGLSLEFVQFFLFPNRFFEWIDALANTGGVFVGFWVFRLFFAHE